MPGSSSYIPSAGIPGLTLRAWALVNASGVLVKGFNVTSVLRNSAGNFTLNLTNNMPDALVLLDAYMHTNNAGAKATGVHLQNASVSQVVYQTVLSATATDPSGNHWIGVYG